jgi:phage terminase large subunit-like protein
MFLVGDPLTLWTAHQTKTSFEGFLRIKSWIDGSDDLRSKVHRFNASHGEEGVELRSGARLRFLARSKSSGRGFSPQRIIFDEAQELSKVAVAAMVPSMRAQVNKQAIYTGTVPGSEVGAPEQFTRLRDRGRAGGSNRLAWAEWSPKGSDDPLKARHLDLDDRKLWAAANPALGFRVSEQGLESDRETLADDDFAREALSIWPTLPKDVGGVIDSDAWDALRDGTAKPPKRVCLVLDVSPDRSSAAIGVAGAGPDGKTLVLVRTGQGTAWLVPELKKLLKKRDIVEVAMHPSTQAAVLIRKLKTADIEYEPLTKTQLGQACADFQTAVDEATLVHIGQPELDAAVGNAKTRFIDEAELWDRKDRGVDISALVAASTAAFRWAQQDADYDLDDSIG